MKTKNNILSFITLIAFSLCLFTAPSIAEENPNSTPNVEQFEKEKPESQLSLISGDEYDYWTEFFKMLSLLGLVLLALVGSSWFLKRLLAQRAEHLNQSNDIKILERRVLNQKALIYLIEVSGRRIVVGESPAGLSCLAQFSDDLEISSGTPTFGGILQKKMQEE